MHEGHRKRILQRLLENDPQLQDHELIEIMLFRTIPRMNTNGIAHELLATFGSVYHVLNAPVEQLCLVKGIGPESAEYIRTMGLLFERVEKTATAFPKSFSRAGFSEYLCRKFAPERHEVIEIFTTDKQDRITLCRRFTSSREDAVQVDAKEICELITAAKAHGIVVAHNHPNKSSLPSREDDSFTGRLCILCALQNARFYDHLIVGNDGVYSYFETGRMEELRKEYSMAKVFGEGDLLR